jgi:signal transduction histidine kinase
MANDKLTETNEKFTAVNKELTAVNKEVVQLNEQIKQYQEKQNEFINIMAHELKTPIQSILGYIEILSLEPDKKFEYEERIIRNAERLQKTISDILDMSKIDNNALSLNKEQFNLKETILPIVQDIKKQIIRDNKKVNIVYSNNDIQEKDIEIEGDKARIIQVMSNILDNAIKFTKEGTISIDLEISRSIDNNNYNFINSKEIILSIKDSGKGIDSETFPHLFSKFFSRSGIGGTGLGLYICKFIVEAHGGKIWANNNGNGKGATISFSLPRYTQQQ